ncbi:MAG: GIY-YIG nuclease family protein [Patescibacteria group bacterium]|nr:GIY-YIG nuclease family protein [Patescibacteria group bacterium]
MLRSLTSYYVYIVECSDKSYYTGVTNNIDRRIWEHNNDEDSKHYTYNRRPVILKYLESFQNIDSAIVREKQIKGWTRKKKEALMRGDENELFRLARGRRGYMKNKKK